MTPLPSAEPLPLGTRPTDPGWYLRRLPSGDQDFVEIVKTDEGLAVIVTGDEVWSSLTERMDDGDAFIARIYPDRIGQE